MFETCFLRLERLAGEDMVATGGVMGNAGVGFCLCNFGSIYTGCWQSQLPILQLVFIFLWKDTLLGCCKCELFVSVMLTWIWWAALTEVVAIAILLSSSFHLLQQSTKLNIVFPSEDGQARGKPTTELFTLLLYSQHKFSVWHVLFASIEKINQSSTVGQRYLARNDTFFGLLPLT